MKSGNLNFLEISGPLQACNGTALPLPFTVFTDRVKVNKKELVPFSVLSRQNPIA
jgi:hypothetical protein